MKRLIPKYQKLISIIMALVLLLTCSTFSSAAQFEQTAGQHDAENKIENDLREAMDAAGDEEFIPVCLWRKDIDSAELNALIFEKTGFDPELYEDLTGFNEVVVPEIEEAVRAELYADSSIKQSDLAEKEASLIKEATRVRVDEYIHQKRLVIREEYTKRNKEFLENAFIERPDRKLFLCSQYTPTIFIEATKPEIEALVHDESVESISLHVEYQCEATTSDVLSQVGVYFEGNAGAEYPGPYSELTGAGVKIGVLEAVAAGTNGAGGKYNELAAQLYGNENLHYIDNVRPQGGIVPSAESLHATMVVSILAGQTVVKNGKTYRGVVPDATIYQTPVAIADDIITGIEACLQNDVVVINMSLGSLGETYYSYIERQIDRYVIEDNVVLVIAAGNEGNDMGYLRMIRSPGRSYNAITVGNAMTKTDTNTVLSAPYPISWDSCHFEPECFANKPDLVAPGWVSVPVNNYYEDSEQAEPYFDRGTSFSSPIVAGIAAQIIENNPAYALHPSFVKAALLIGADLSLMDTSNDTQTTPFIYNKCGAGMVNAVNSLQSDIHLEYYGPVSHSVIPMNTYDYYFYAGDRVRAALTFNKCNNYSLDIDPTDHDWMNYLDDLDLLLVKRDEERGDYLVSYSDSLTNNNEIIDVEIPSDGEYYFIIYVRHIADYSNPPFVGFEFIHTF